MMAGHRALAFLLPFVLWRTSVVAAAQPITLLQVNEESLRSGAVAPGAALPAKPGRWFIKETVGRRIISSGFNPRSHTPNFVNRFDSMWVTPMIPHPERVTASVSLPLPFAGSGAIPPPLYINLNSRGNCQGMVTLSHVFFKYLTQARRSPLVAEITKTFFPDLKPGEAAPRALSSLRAYCTDREGNSQRSRRAAATLQTLGQATAVWPADTASELLTQLEAEIRDNGSALIGMTIRSRGEPSKRASGHALLVYGIYDGIAEFRRPGDKAPIRRNVQLIRFWDPNFRFRTQSSPEQDNENFCTLIVDSQPDIVSFSKQYLDHYNTRLPKEMILQPYEWLQLKREEKCDDDLRVYECPEELVGRLMKQVAADAFSTHTTQPAVTVFE